MKKGEQLIALIEEYKITKDSRVFEEIIELNQGLIAWYLNNTNTNFSHDELYSIIIVGIEKACLSYKEGTPMQQISLRIRTEIEHGITECNIKNKRLFENFLEVKGLIEKRFNVTLEKDFSLFDYIIDEMEIEGMISYHDKEKIRVKLLNMLKDYYGSLELKKGDLNRDSLISFTDSKEFLELIKATLTEREFNFITQYYGLNSKRQTLRELSQEYGITQERIRIINENAIRKLKGALEYHVNALELPIDINSINDFMKSILTKDELEYLSLSLGLFGNKEHTIKEICELCSADYTTISNKLILAKEKIRIALNSYFVSDKYDLSLILNSLKSKLSKKELEIFADAYGLFGHERIETLEIARKYKCGCDSIISTKKRTIAKINEMLNQVGKTKVKEFLNTFLTDLETNALLDNFGIFKDRCEAICDLAIKYNVSYDMVSKAIRSALGKINVLIMVREFKYDTHAIKEFLEKILGEDEFKYFCLNNGLYGYDVNSLRKINRVYGISMVSLKSCKANSVNKIKRYLKGIAN